MECPYCNKEMRAGYIWTGSKGASWWDNENNAENFWGMPNRVPLFKGGWASEELGPAAWYCADCRKIVMDVPEIEQTSEKLKRKWNDLTGKAAEKLDEARARREKENREKKREANRKKDPWEID